MRSFIAIEIPKELEEEIKKIQEQLPREDCKLVISKGFHITLIFLGDIKDDYVEEVKQKLAETPITKFNLTFSNMGVFPNENYIRVVWLGFKDDSHVNALQRFITEKLDFKEDKRFHAHLTLARVKFVKDKKSFVEQLRKIKIPEMRFKVDKFKLIKSELTPEGPIYTDLAEYNLG